jgi:enoyl-CoA hydratase/carnithine racemase
VADLEVEVVGGTHWVRLNRPRVLNAITTALKDELLAALERAEDDPGAVCLVLTGTGRAFCAGADTRELAAAGEVENLLTSVARVERTQRLVERMRRSRLATIAAVNGIAAGGGVSLALACDIVVAAGSARFALLFGARGLVPDAGLTRHLVESVGRRRALALALTCADLDADEALRCGLVDAVTPDDELVSRVTELAADLVGRGAHTIALTKRAFAAPQHSDLSLEALTQAVALQGAATPGTRTAPAKGRS